VSSRPTATIARHALAYATGSAVGGITRAVLLPVIARKLSTEDYGVFSLLLAATNLIHPVLELGLVTALIKFHNEAGDAADRHRIRSVVFLMMPAFDVLIAAPILLARGAISQVLFGTSAYGAFVALAVAIAFFGAQFQLFLGHLRASDRSREFALLMVIKGTVSLALTLYLVLGLEKGIGGLLIGNLAGPATVALIVIPRLLLRSGIDLQGARSRLRSLLVFGVPLVPSAIGIWALSHLDVYLLRVLADLTSVGIYSFGSEICLPIALAYLSFNLAWPTFAFSRARQEGGPEALAKVFRHAFVVLVGLALVISGLRREIVAVVGTETFAASIRVIPALALATCLYAASQVFATGLQVAGNTRRLPLFVLFAVVTNAALNLLLIPLYREIGAAAATAVTNFVLAYLVLWESNRQFPIPFEIGRLLRILGAAAVLLLATDVFGDLSLGVGIAVRLAVVSLFPILLVPLGAISAGELRALPSVLREIGQRRSP
jgi:O-antigen/teichoic acid export membrane protein